MGRGRTLKPKEEGGGEDEYGEEEEDETQRIKEKKETGKGCEWRKDCPPLKC